jgi:alpha-ketoglutarate-dependent taurine dioxygenase
VFIVCSITFERIPSDYAILKIVQPPEDAGGDTLWASGYEAYDRLSPAFQKLAEGLTATHYQPEFNRTAKKHGLDLIDEERGAPENKGLDFEASHPVIRMRSQTARDFERRELTTRRYQPSDRLEIALRRRRPSAQWLD